MKVSEILRTKGDRVATVEPDESVRTAVARMSTRAIGALVVVDRDGRIVGVVSERDVMRALATSDVAAMSRLVRDVMTTDVVTCGRDDRLGELMAVMTRRRIRHIPVVEAGRLVGIVSIGDLVKSRLEELELESRVLRDAYLRVH
ncbi:MAG: CBS domain-containing protein [Ilumatobacteraceae bacterium]